MKEKVVNFLKFTTLCYAMAMGFFFTYAIAFIAIGLPPKLSGWVSLVLSVLTTLGYVKWIEN